MKRVSWKWIPPGTTGGRRKRFRHVGERDDFLPLGECELRPERHAGRRGQSAKGHTAPQNVASMRVCTMVVYVCVAPAFFQLP